MQNQLQRSSDAAPTVNAALVGPTLIGQRCWVRWPYLQEAIVEGVSDSTEKVSHQPVPAPGTAVSLLLLDGRCLKHTGVTDMCNMG